MSTPKSVICLWGEEGVGIPLRVWEVLVGRAECPNLKKIYNIAYREDRRVNIEGVAYESLRDHINTLVAEYMQTVDSDINEGHINYALDRLTVGSQLKVCPYGNEEVFCTIIAYRNEEWFRANMDVIVTAPGDHILCHYVEERDAPLRPNPGPDIVHTSNAA